MKPEYLTRAGWGFDDSDAKAGDVIEPSDYWTDVDRALLVPVEEPVPCDFCNEEGMVAERGFVSADYQLQADGGDPLAFSCHSCMSDAPILDRQAVPYPKSDYLVPYDEYDPDDWAVPEGTEPVTHPDSR